MSPQPLVTVLIPSYNQGQFIADTIQTTLNQGYKPLQILVMDGASTDGTLQALAPFADDIELHSEPDNGVVDAVNKGLALARGEIIGIQSSDDMYAAGAIQAAVDALQTKPDLGLVFGDLQTVAADGTELERSHIPPFSLLSNLAHHNWIPQPGCFFRAHAGRIAGLWDEEVPYAADSDFFRRIAADAGASKLERIQALRRRHPEQRDTQGDRIVRDHSRSLDKFLGRRRFDLQEWRSAQAGKQMIQHRYAVPTPLRQARRRWLASICYPHYFQQFSTLSYVPSYYATRHKLSKYLKQFRP